MSLEDIVNVTIDRQTTVPSRVGFGTPLFVGETSAGGIGPDRIRSYNSISEVGGDFAVSDPEFKMAQAAFSQNPRPTVVKIGRKDALDATWADALAAIELIDNDWYGLAVTTRAQADIEAIAAHIEARRKIFIAASADAPVKDPGAVDDVASSLVTSAFARTALMFHNQAATVYPDAAWLGLMLPTDPGAATWKFKTLNGIPADVLTTTELNAVLDKNANVYTQVGGVNITQEGTMAEPEFIDVIHFVDWLQARMTERIFGALVNQDKLPYTNAGITAVESLIREQLDIGVERGGIAAEPEFTVTVPDVLETDSADRAARLLRDITFNARLAGAIHKVEVRGTVVV